MKLSSNSIFSVPLSITLKPTVTLSLLVVIPHMLAFLIVVVLIAVPTSISSVSSSSLVWVAGFVTISCIIVSLVYFSRLHIWKILDKSIKEIHQDSAKNWSVIVCDEETKSVQLLTTSFISTFLVVLNFKDLNSRIYTAIIVSDSLPGQDFRRLRVRIKTS